MEEHIGKVVFLVLMSMLIKVAEDGAHPMSKKTVQYQCEARDLL